jgi:hypothetical protein
MSEITLTDGQQAALDKFNAFLADPIERTFVIRGYSGTGKSTLIATLLDRLPNYDKMLKLIDPEYRPLQIALTATTHKAAENFSQITGMDVSTIHSFLGLRVDKDPLTGRTQLVAGRNSDPKSGCLIFVDEASMIDSGLLSLIFQQTPDSKIVFIGDPAQLPPVKATNTPVFDAGFTEAALTQVMRQTVNGVPQSNPITELATMFRYAVENPGKWPEGIKPDGQFIIYCTDAEFQAELDKEFTRPDWMYRDSKILAWTNNRVIQYNQYIRQLLKGDPQLQVGDYAENNSFVASGKTTLKTDQTVYISDISGPDEYYYVQGKNITLDGTSVWFMPDDRKDKERALNLARNNRDWAAIRHIESWVDLRAVFAQTVNKSQGSTYDRVYIDLSDIGQCKNGILMARMLYVAISRARSQVFFRGDIK